MRVKCNANTGDKLSAKYLIGNTHETVFHVAIGKEYNVFAVAVYCGATLFLLSDDNDLPNWYPVELFMISDARVPHDWLCSVYPENDGGLQFLLGYEQLITDDSQYDALIERVPSALEVFRKVVHSCDSLS